MLGTGSRHGSNDGTTKSLKLDVDILGGPPHPAIVTIRDDKDYIRVQFYSYYTTITGWGVLLMDI